MGSVKLLRGIPKANFVALNPLSLGKILIAPRVSDRDSSGATLEDLGSSTASSALDTADNLVTRALWKAPLRVRATFLAMVLLKPGGNVIDSFEEISLELPGPNFGFGFGFLV